MLDIIGIKSQVVQGNFLFNNFFRRFHTSGLSVDVVPAHVGAVGLDFSKQKLWDYTDWSLEIKVINPQSEPIAIEDVTATWKGARGFTAKSSFISAAKPITPKSSLPKDYGEYLPMLIEPQSTYILRVNMYMGLYKRYMLLFRRRHAFHEEEYDSDSRLRLKIVIKSSKGKTKIKI